MFNTATVYQGIQAENTLGCCNYTPVHARSYLGMASPRGDRCGGRGLVPLSNQRTRDAEQGRGGEQ